MTVSPLLDALELPIPDPRFQPLLSSLTSDHSAVTAFDPRERLIGISLTVLVMAGFIVSLRWFA